MVNCVEGHPIEGEDGQCAQGHPPAGPPVGCPIIANFWMPFKAI